MIKPRKFAPGQRVWLYDQNRRVYLNGSSSPDHESSYVEHEITGISGRSYHIARVLLGRLKGHVGHVETVGFDKAERTYLTTEEKDDEVFRQTYSNGLAETVRIAGAATLRKVKAILEEAAREGKP